MKKAILAAFAAAAALLALGCSSGGSGTVLATGWDIGVPTNKTLSYSMNAGDTLYLVRVNPSTSITVPYNYTGDVYSATLSVSALRPTNLNNIAAEEQKPAGLTHHKQSLEFKLPEIKAVSILDQSASLSPGTPSYSTSNTVGDSKNFHVQYDEENNPYWMSESATLRAVGTNCKIWVTNSNYDSTNNTSNDTDNKVTPDRITDLVSKFDALYPLETNFFGREMQAAGAQKGYATSGDGIDEDPKIQILIYDISHDHTPGYTQNSGIGGFFWAKDEYPYSNTYGTGPAGYHSNEAEIFYLDAHFLDSNPDWIYATLAHEFLHMIMFNQKELRYNTNAETWFNETCALMAEDMLAPRIGVLATNNSHAIGMRIPYFNSFYFFYPLTQWSDAYSYSTGFAFGAFLTRNYGGAEFFREMFNNSKLNADCIQAALQAKSGNPSMSFADAVRTFPEAVLFSGTSGTLPSLNKTVNGSGTVAGPPNNTSLNLSGYNFTAVDLYSTDTPPNLKVPLSVRHYFDSNLNTALATKYSKGPLFFGYSDDIEGDVLPIICDIPPTGFTITDLGNGGSGAGTIPTSGSITITTYSNSPIEFYLYKKTSLGAVTKL